MRTPVVLAALVLLAGATAGVAVGAPTGPDASAVSAAPAAQDGNDTAVQVGNLTIQRLDLTGVNVGDVRLGDVALARGNDSSSLGTATASNLTVENATLRNVTFRDLTVRNETLADQLVGDEAAEDGTVTLENATLSNASIESLVVEETRFGSVSVNDVRTALSSGETNETDRIAGEPTLEARNMTADSVVLDAVAADDAGIENASAGVGSVMDDGNGTDGGNETGALAAP